MKPRRGNKALLMLGVAGACALGVGAGLWARPAPEDQNPSLKPADPPPVAEPTRKLQIVVDDSPAPVGQPIEVLPGSGTVIAAPPPRAVLPADPEPMAPAPRATGLVRVQSVEPIVEAPEPAPAPKAAPRKPAEKPAKVEKPKVQKTLARAEPPKAEKAKLRRPEPAKKKEAARKAAEKPARAKAKVVVAEAEAPKKKGVLSRFMAKLAPHHREAAKVEVAEDRPARSKKKAAEPARPLRGGSVKVASAKASRCVSPDPGAAIVCADPALSAADRRLSQAYAEAEAAGVSPAQLKRQQARWLQARSAAAKEAPWAVHDVYLARISELNDQARDARGGGW